MMHNQQNDINICPRCFDEQPEQNIRTAQFGGTTGGNTNPYAPGTSPFGKGGGNQNYGINTFGVDKTFESIISGTHNPPPIDEHRNFEKRLEVYHQHQEDNMIPYWLSPEEREKLRIKKEVRRRYQWLADSKKSVDQNSVEYIQNNFHPALEHITPKELQLSALHKYKVGDKLKFEDELPDVMPPERVHTAQITHGRTSPFDNTVSDEEQEFYPSFDNIRMKTPVGLGNAKLLTQGSELDEYLNEAFKADWGGLEGPNEPTLMDYPNADQVGDHRGARMDKQPSMVDIDDDELAAFMPLEQQLSNTNKPKTPQRNPNDPYSYWSEHFTAKGVDNPGEDLGFADKYSGGSFNPSPIPRV